MRILRLCVEIQGIKASDGIAISSPWEEASGEKYHRFGADESHGPVEWEDLLIVVKSLGEAAAVKAVPRSRDAEAYYRSKKS